MEKLKLPVVIGKTPESKRLSMDDYLKFVYLNLKYTLDRKANRKSKRQAAVNVPFLLRTIILLVLLQSTYFLNL